MRYILPLLLIPTFALAQIQLGRQPSTAPFYPQENPDSRPSVTTPKPTPPKTTLPIAAKPQAKPKPQVETEVPLSQQDEIVIAPPKQKINNPTAIFSGLDKVTGRIITFDVALNETVQFGALQITPRVCYSRPPTETPQTTSFVEVNEITLQNEKRKIFTGWMFAASPGLSGVEHAVYDVWLSDCKQGPAYVPEKAKP